jgi:diguanylate cyclase (GGDEF)-like protein
MKTDANTDLTVAEEHVVSLSRTLEQNAHVMALMQEAAGELASVNRILTQEFAKQERPPKIEQAIKKSKAVEDKVQEASAKLTAVNRALEREIRDRIMLDYRFAAATEQEAASRHAAFHDGLTGLANRALFDDRLEHGLAQAQRHGWNLAVLFMDLDNFKKINDSNGHDVGDAVLRIIAGRLKENTRNDDTLSRHGGDEFLYLLMESRDERDVASIAQNIINIVQAPCNVRIRDQGFSLTVKASIGIALFPKDGSTANILVKSADAAMYQAKQHKYGYSFAG